MPGEVGDLFPFVSQTDENGVETYSKASHPRLRFCSFDDIACTSSRLSFLVQLRGIIKLAHCFVLATDSDLIKNRLETLDSSVPRSTKISFSFLIGEGVSTSRDGGKN
jgi:hypothetical protein